MLLGDSVTILLSDSVKILLGDSVTIILGDSVTNNTLLVNSTVDCTTVNDSCTLVDCTIVVERIDVAVG